MTTAQARSLPLRVEPWPGESLDSWVQQLAALYDIRVRDMGERLGLDPRPPHQWTERLSRSEIERVAVAGGLAPSQVEAMTVNGWQSTWAGQEAPRLHPDPPSTNCPRCLVDNGGRWLLAWRLPLHRTCRRHQVLLNAGCARYGHPIRGTAAAYRVPEPPRCDYGCRVAIDPAAATVVVPGSAEAAGAAFLHDLAALGQDDRVLTSTGAILTPLEAYREAALLTERMRTELHPHDQHDARTGSWQPARACGRPWKADSAPDSLYGWALAAEVLLAANLDRAVGAVRWLVQRERRLTRFPRTPYEHARMPQAVGPVAAEVLDRAIHQVSQACPDTPCETEMRIARLRRKPAHRSDGPSGLVDYDNYERFLWEEALRGWDIAFRAGRARRPAAAPRTAC